MADAGNAPSGDAGAGAHGTHLPPIARTFLQKMRHVISGGLVQARELFEMADTNDDGHLTLRELFSAAKCFEVDGVDTSEGKRAVTMLFKAADREGTGRVSIDDFIAFVRGTESPPARTPAKTSGAGASSADGIDRPRGTEAVHELRHKIRDFVKRGIVRDLSEVFEVLDEDSNGTVTMDELQDAFADLQLIISDDELEHLFDHIDENHNGSIDIGEFMRFLDEGEEADEEAIHPHPNGVASTPPAAARAPASSAGLSPSARAVHDAGPQSPIALRLRSKLRGFVERGLVSDLQAVFDMMDFNSDGKITVAELGDAFKVLHMEVAPYEVEGLFAHIDADHDGSINVGEFLTFMGEQQEQSRSEQEEKLEQKQEQKGGAGSDDDGDSYSTDTFEADTDTGAGGDGLDNGNGHAGDGDGGDSGDDEYSAEKPGGDSGLIVRGTSILNTSRGSGAAGGEEGSDDGESGSGDDQSGGDAFDNDDEYDSKKLSPMRTEWVGDVSRTSDGRGAGANAAYNEDEDDDAYSGGLSPREDAADVTDAVERDAGYRSHVAAAAVTDAMPHAASSRKRRAMGGAAFVQQLTGLSTKARVLCFISQLFRCGEITTDERAVLKELALDCNDVLEAAVEVLVLDNNVPECSHTFRRVVYASSG